MSNIFTEALKDEAYYISWRANIAMAFQDECARHGLVDERIYEISNAAANEFLRRLMLPTGDG